MPLSLAVYFPLPSDFTGINYTCLSLCEAMQSESLELEVITPMVRRNARRSFMRPLVPQKLSVLPYRRFRTVIDRLTVTRFLKSSASKDAVYLWSDVPLHVTERLYQMGVPVIREKFNCHKAYAKGILDGEYERLGLEPGHRITERSIEKERRELELADFIFSPSPMVKRSLVAEGVDTSKVIDSSYGWEPGRVGGEDVAGNGARARCKVLFVGRLSVRKGVHLLLEYWEQAGIDGELVLAGGIDEDVAERCRGYLSREDVVCPGHVSDVGQLYREADVFVFPSLEEGGPLVTYEAMSCGLPVIVSPMGAGAVVQDGVHGYVRDAHDEGGWVACLRGLAGSVELRAEFGEAGKARMEKYTWSEVGRRREAAVRRLISATS